MATTFKFVNGDVVMNGSTGRPKLIGNSVGEEDRGQSKAKNSQDLQRSLSIGRVRNGTSAAIVDLIGVSEQAGLDSTSILLDGQIRNMFSRIISAQRNRRSIRPPSERFTNIRFLQVFPDKTNRTTFRFRLVTSTENSVVTQSGSIS